jgi:sulfur relay (sulfurtransferase) DsrF/TusC family protein
MPVIRFCRLPDHLLMAKNLAVVIQEDPRKSHRPVEALRIALGLASGSHMTTVVLLGEAVCLLGDEIDDIRDVEILEKYLPMIEQLKIPFILRDALDQIPVRDEFSIRRENDETINHFVRSTDCALIF